MHSLSAESNHVVIVGGGLSGLAAAVELASHDIPITVLEQKPKLGGRAHSFIDGTTGDSVDNGQHVMIAAYERTMAFLERIGTKHLLSIQGQPLLYLHHPQRGMCEFRLPRLPSPFHLVVGVLTSNLFSLPDKLRLLRAGLSIQSASSDRSLANATIEQWLTTIGQSAEAKRSFWEPLAIAIMNEHIAKASAAVFVRALRRAFFARNLNASVVLPRVGLSELFIEKAVKYILDRGGDVRTNADVTTMVWENGAPRGVMLRNGASVLCDALILAVPHYRIEELLPIPLRGVAPAMTAAASTPIVSIHLWFNMGFMRHDFVGLIGRRVQWVFNRRKITTGERNFTSHVSCVISAGSEFVEMTNEQLIQIALDDLRSVYRATPRVPVHAVVIREKRATFSCTPEVERFRPDNATAVPNLFLAGDWTNTGLPATIEGAIVSGEKCAKLARAFLRHAELQSTR
jgi:squalene-associated FAD-dependent desaturase